MVDRRMTGPTLLAGGAKGTTAPRALGLGPQEVQALYTFSIVGERLGVGVG